MGRFVLTISYADYMKSPGGTDRTILAHQKMFNREGITNYHIYPINQIWRFKTHIDYLWGLCIDGEFIKVIETHEILSLLKKCVSKGDSFDGVIIHHLRKISLVELSHILDNIAGDFFLYIHDYMMICPETGLVKNNDSYCGAEFPSVHKCMDCCYANTELFKRVEGIRTFLEKYQYRIVCICPSDTAKTIWTTAYPIFLKRSVTVSHQVAEGRYYDNNDLIRDNEPIRIAFVGYQAPIKGWKYWKEASEKLHFEERNVELYQFGKCEEHRDYVTEVRIDFRESLTSMTDELRKHKIHCAVLWSLCPETYSFTYYEAFAANCYIITNKYSGNIADQVKRNMNGLVADSPEMLYKILSCENQLREQINIYRLSRPNSPKILKENNEIVKMIKERDALDIRYQSSINFRKFWRMLYQGVFSLFGIINRVVKGERR